MATLVLSTVGTALGGPVGAAIGAIIGQSIDQQLLGGGSRGPRIGDLSVQTSSYGTQIPRVYGAMRVAGSVVWATDLVQSAETAGAKGQPDTTFSYAVSFAVAVSSRPIIGIGRIWADGKLIRESDGTFKVPVTFRVHHGSEDQAVDPLIASIEEISNTPAYRGLALAVFEDLELVEFGNRIPFLTFEVLADEDAPSVGSILTDATGGLARDDLDRRVEGFAAYGSSARAAITPLVEAFGLQLFDDGDQLRPADEETVIVLGDDLLGNAADDEPVAKVQLDVAAVGGPASLRLSYYDPLRDFQTAEARASMSDEGGSEQVAELPAVIDRSSAKSIAEDLLGRRWAEREKLKLRLPPQFLDLEPGAILRLETSPDQMWRVDRCTIDRFAVIAEMRRHRSSIVTGGAGMSAAGAISALSAASPNESEELRLALFEVASLDQTQTEPTLLLAASSSTSGWRPQSARLEVGCRALQVSTARRKSVLGYSVTSIPAGGRGLQGNGTNVEVQLVDRDQWLTSSDDAALACGANLAILGRELIQFGDARPLGDGRFQLSRLFRGVAGTEVPDHPEGEAFALAEPDSLRAITLPPWSKGKGATVRARKLNGGEASASAVVPTPHRQAHEGEGRQLPAIPSPAGGSTVDSEARMALEAILETMRRQGLIES